MSSFCVYRGIVIFKHQRNIREKYQIIDHQQTFLILYPIKDNRFPVQTLHPVSKISLLPVVSLHQAAVKANHEPVT